MKLASVALAAVTGLAAATSLNSLKIQFQNPLAAAGDAGTLDEPVPGESPIQICDEESETRLLDIKYVNLTPNPPARGGNLTIEAEAEVKKQIEQGAYIDVDVRYGYIRLLKQTFDLCEQIENVDKKCPLEKGIQNIVKDVQLPNEIPPGKYVVNARAYTVDDEFITCLSATVEFPYEL